MELKIEYIAVEDLKPYEKNANKHDEKSVEVIANSIKEFGMCDPIGIWGDTIVEGHGRLMALKQLGYTEVPCIRLDHLTDEQRRAYTLAHNKTNEFSEWDVKTLLEELQGLTDIFTGFEIGDIFADDLDEKDNSVLDENENGVIYKITFQTQNKELIEAIKKIVKEHENEE